MDRQTSIEQLNNVTFILNYCKYFGHGVAFEQPQQIKYKNQCLRIKQQRKKAEQAECQM